MANKIEKFCIGCGVVLLVGSAGVAQAQEKTGQASGGKDPLQVSVGALGLYTPEYEGSDEYEISVLPNFDIRYEDRVFFNMRDGFGANALVGENYKLGASLGYNFGRDEDDSDDLAGMGDIDGGMTANLLGEYRWGRVVLSSKLSHQFTGDDDMGMTAGFKAAAPLRATEQLTVIPSIGTTYASDDYMQTQFGVSSSQSASSGYSQYDPEGGFKDMTVGVAVNYALNENWSVNGNASYSRLLGDAADSPIVQDENQFFTGLGLSYKF